MTSTTAPHFQRILTLIGCMFLLMPGGIDLYWGGISVYVLSFIACRINSDSQLELPVTLSLYLMFWATGIAVSGMICKRIGRGWVILFGTIIANSALYSSYMAIQISFTFFNIVFAGFAGFGIGIIYGTCMHIIAQSAGKSVGLFTSLLMTSASIGAIIITQLITWYTNPENKSPTWDIGSTSYFTQKDVVNRIPSMFLVLGGVMSTVYIAGLTILFFISGAISSKSNITKMAETDLSQCDKVRKEDGYDRISISNTNTSNSGDSVTDITPPNEDQDFTFKDTIKTTTFYALGLSFLITQFSSFLTFNYYKLYGQLWIKDDHFLSNVGTTGIFTIAILRAITGVALDKFGVRNCLVVLLFSLIFVMSWFYFTPMAGQWVYLFASICSFGVDGALYSSFFSAIALIFGKTHLTSNLGSLLIASVAFDLAAPIIMKTILTNSGWFCLFGSAGGLNLVAFVLCILFVP